MYDICIIGSGQSGLVTCKTFSEKNYNVIVLEKTNNCNGLFNTIKEKNYFKWSTSRSMSGFSDFPMDKNLPNWFKIQDYINYLESYKKHFNLDKYIQYNSNVINCKQDENENWMIRYINNGIEKDILCKKLIICSGLNQTPKFPDIINNYTGEILHTEKVYKDMTTADWKNKFTSKRVLLLGGGESAFDVGHIISQYTNDFYLASKNYIEWFPQGDEDNKNLERAKKINDKCISLPDFLNNPTDTNLFFAEYSLPEPMSEIWHTCGRWFLHTYFNANCNDCNHQHTELCSKTKTPNDLFKKYVVKRTEFYIDIYENKVKPIYYPDKIQNKNVYSKDGTIENVDIIVCATGFKKKFPFLDDNIINDEFIKKMIPKNTSNIAFIGYARPTMGSIAAIAEMQSWWVESYFNNSLKYSIRKPLFRFKDPLNLENEHINTLVIGCYYLKDLAKDMNIEPNMLYIFFTDFTLFKKIYTGSCHPMIYRIHGNKKYTNSREILINTFRDFDNDNSFQEKLYFFMFILFHFLFLLILFILSYLIRYLYYTTIDNKRNKYIKNLSIFYIFFSFVAIFYFF